MGKTNHKKSQLWHELKRLWDQFDPSGAHVDESGHSYVDYDSYVSSTLQLLEDEAAFTELNDYIKYVVAEYIQPSIAAVTDDDIASFVQRVQQWYGRKR